MCYFFGVLLTYLGLLSRPKVSRLPVKNVYIQSEVSIIYDFLNFQLIYNTNRQLELRSALGSFHSLSSHIAVISTFLKFLCNMFRLISHSSSLHLVFLRRSFFGCIVADGGFTNL